MRVSRVRTVRRLGSLVVVALASLAAPGSVMAQDLLVDAAGARSTGEPARSAVALTDRTAKLHVEDVPLHEAFDVLQQSSGVLLAYSPAVFPMARSVTCRCRDVSVEDAVATLLDDIPFEFSKAAGQLVVRRSEQSGDALDARLPAVRSAHDMRRQMAAVGLGVPIESRDLQGSIAGRVLDASSREPLSGVQVYVAGTEMGALTQAGGRFLILNVPTGTHTVQAELIGYRSASQEVTVAEGETAALNFELRQQALALDELVVTGTAGAQQARSLGNVVGEFDVGEIQRAAPQANMDNLLKGNVAGLNVDLGSGEVGVGATMRVRGAGSLVLSSNPLVYIDGVRVNNEAGDQYGSSVGVDGTGAPTRLNDIDPEMIESIEVIKGPAAATLYGTEASNGVIQIITKKGVEGEPQFTLTSKVGQSWYPDPRKHWPKSYFTCQGIGDGSCTPGEIVGVNVFQEDWERYGMNHFRVGTPYGLSGAVSGGGNGLRYHFNLGWDHDEGAIPYNWKNQLNGRGNLDWAPRDDLTIALGLGLVRSKFSSASAEQPITVAFHWACPGAGCEEGSGQPNALDGPFRGYIAYLPDVYEENARGGQDVIRNTYNLTTNHQPFDWLDHRLIVGFDLTETRNHHTLKHLQGQVGANPRQGMREVEYQTTEYLSLDYGATATWAPMSGLELATSAGVQFYDKTVESVQSEGENFPVPTLESISAGAEQSTSDFFIQNKTFGMYVQEQFSWQNRLFLTVAGRGDDNSAFGRDFDFVVYPKVSASWVVSEEAALSDVDWLTSLRLRGAWGEAGQQPDIFAAARLYEPVTSFQGQPGVTPATVGNEAVEPEVGEEIELGFDAGLFDDRLAVEFTYYNQDRRNALINVPVRPSTGFPGTQFRNLGEIRNTGYEIGLEWDAYRGQDVNVHFGTSLHLNDNEITDMGGIDPLPLTASNPSTGWSRQRFAEGFPVGAIFGPRVVSADIVGEGLDARAVNVMCESGPVAIPGTNLTRGGGEPVPCDSENAPEVFWGQPIPTRELGFTATVTLFNDLRLYAQLDYEGGHHLIDGHVAAAHTFFRNTREIEERDDPILLGYETLADLGTNQPGLFDASFARIRTVSASYTLPESLAASIGASAATFSVSGQNLWMPWRAQEEGFGRKIVDPELRYTGASGTDPGGLTAYFQDVWPTHKRFNATLRVTF